MPRESLSTPGDKFMKKIFISNVSDIKVAHVFFIIVSCNWVFHLSTGVTDTLESNSILIYFVPVISIDTQQDI